MGEIAPAYRSAAYAAALGKLGRVLPLGETGGFVIERSIAGTGWRDLMGPYPLLCCADWHALEAAVAALGTDYVTLTIVTDPFCPLPPEKLAASFPLCRPFHDHHIIDLDAPPAPSRHHRRSLRQAADGIRLEAGSADPGLLEQWVQLYAALVVRKTIGDMRAFDRESLAHQLSVPGAQLVTAWEDDDLLGADLYYADHGVIYAHLSAYSEKGYARSVSYPMMAHAIRYFSGRARYLDLGGAPAGAGQGVAQFKRGWSALTRPSYLCGKVLDPTAFGELCAPLDPAISYFPPYRLGEFG